MYTLDFSGAKTPVQEELVLVVENRLLTMVDAGVAVVVVVESICVWDLEEQDEDGCSGGGGGGGCDLVVGPRAMTDEFALKQFCVYSSRIRHVTLGAECFKGNIALEKFQLPRCLPGGSFRAGESVSLIAPHRASSRRIALRRSRSRGAGPSLPSRSRPSS